jgi:hypothetical protein
LTIDQIETLSNKTMSGSLNTFTNIPHTALNKITDKAKLPDDVMYAGNPFTQSLTMHSDVLIDGLINGHVLTWDSSVSKWKNAVPPASGGLGDVTGAANLSGTGATIFNNETTGILNFNRIRSMSTPLAIANVSNEVQLTIASASTVALGVIQLATNQESSATKACAANDTRLSNDRAPTAHKTSHQSGGSDSIKIDDLVTPDDNTDLNVSTIAHGLCPKLPNNTTTFLRGDGTYAAPTQASSGITVLDREVSEINFSGTSAEQTILSTPLAGGLLGTNGAVRATIAGDFSQNTGSGEFLNVKIKIDNTVIWGDDIGAPDGTDDPCAFWLEFMLAQGNSSGVVKIAGFGAISPDNPGLFGGVGSQDDDEGTIDFPFKGSLNIDMSIARTLTVTITHSSTSSNMRFRRDFAIVEQL